MYQGIEHTAIAAQDTVALATWYCKVFGFEVVYKNQKDPPTYFVKLGTGLLELIPASDTNPVNRENADPGLSHFAISVQDFDAVEKDLGGKGVVLENVREASGGVKVGFLRDPENNLLQVIVRPNPL
ncbi:MAG: VOC family protein [bacterium]|nr:VOC family protein [bacterium]